MRFTGRRDVTWLCRWKVVVYRETAPLERSLACGGWLPGGGVVFRVAGCGLVDDLAVVGCGLPGDGM